MSEVMYLYAVADSDLGDADVTDMRAVGGAPVRIIAEAPIAAVVSVVDAERFSAPALRRQRIITGSRTSLGPQCGCLTAGARASRRAGPAGYRVRERREHPSAAANPRAGFRRRARPSPRLL
jgi:Gas vesicle synthesis protein GvpL/GvpF